jgi:hypothetical protein
MSRRAGASRTSSRSGRTFRATAIPRSCSSAASPRSAGSATYKIFGFSTPEVDSGDEDPDEGEGHCRIDRAFRQSDQRYWNVPCPSVRPALRARAGSLRSSIRPPAAIGLRARVRAPAERGRARRRGAQGPLDRDCGRARPPPGFHVDAFVSLMMSYARRSPRTRCQPRPRRRKRPRQPGPGLPYRYRGDAPEWEKLATASSRTFKRGHVPPRGLLLVGFADVQMRGLWLERRGLRAQRRKLVVDALYIDGDTAGRRSGFRAAAQGDDRPRIPRRLRRNAPKLDALGVDSGYRAHVVYSWVRRSQRAHPTAAAT